MPGHWLDHSGEVDYLESAELSRERAATVAGKWIRRGLVGSIVVQYTEKTGGWLWGLFGPATDEVRFEEIKGYLLTPETRHGWLAVIVIYFGQGAAK